jgi:predicted phage-related endonuclease
MNITITTITELNEACKQFTEYAQLVKEAEAVRDSYKQTITDFMKAINETTFHTDDFNIIYSDNKRTDLDRKSLLNDHADIYEQYIKSTTYKTLKVLEG